MLIPLGPRCNKTLRYQAAYQLERNDRVHAQSERVKLAFENAQCARALEECRAYANSMKDFAAELERQLGEYLSRSSAQAEVLTRYDALCSVIDPVLGRLQEQEYAFGPILRPWGVLQSNSGLYRTPRPMGVHAESMVASTLDSVGVRHAMMSKFPLSAQAPNTARVLREPLPTITPRRRGPGDSSW